MKKLAVLGCGAQSQIFCLNATKHLGNDYFVTSVCAKNHEHAVELANRVGGRAAYTVDDMLELAPDIVVEFAGIEAVETYAEEILEAGADLIISSVGALDDEKFRDHLVRVARQYERKIYITSGAIGGMDLMETYAVVGNPKVQIESIKPPESYIGTPYMEGKTVSETEEQLIFDGNVHDAIRGFPRNVNVSVATALATDAKDAKVRLISKPGITEVSHRITLSNDIMHSELFFVSQPDPENKKNSKSAAYSVIALLKNLASPLTFF